LRRLQLFGLALLAIVAKADGIAPYYQMVLCGDGYGPCTVQPSPDVAPSQANLDAMVAQVAAQSGASTVSVLPLLSSPSGDILALQVLDGTDEYYSAALYRPGYPLVTGIPNSAADFPVEWIYVDMNDSGVFVGWFDFGVATYPVLGSAEGVFYYPGLELNVIPDPRLKKLGIDLSTFDLSQFQGDFTAIDDAGNISGDSAIAENCCEYDLFFHTPEPSTLLLLGVPLAILVGFSRRRRRAH
jgi:hypothetical protein